MSDAKKATNQAKWAEKMDKDWVGNPLAYPVSFGCATLVELEHVYALVCLQFPLAPAGWKKSAQGIFKILQYCTRKTKRCLVNQSLALLFEHMPAFDGVDGTQIMAKSVVIDYIPIQVSTEF